MLTPPATTMPPLVGQRSMETPPATAISPWVTQPAKISPPATAISTSVTRVLLLRPRPSVLVPKEHKLRHMLRVSAEAQWRGGGGVIAVLKGDWGPAHPPQGTKTRSVPLSKQLDDSFYLSTL